MTMLGACAVAAGVSVFGTIVVLALLATVAKARMQTLQRQYSAHQLVKDPCPCASCSSWRRHFAVRA